MGGGQGMGPCVQGMGQGAAMGGQGAGQCGGGFGGVQAQTVAAPQGPPIQANAPIPGNHRRDGRGKVACESCHQILGGAKWQGQLMPAAFGMGDVQAQTVAAQQGPPIQANAPIPGNHRRDGRGKVACESCHQILGGGKWQGQLLPAAFSATPPQNSLDTGASLLPFSLPIAAQGQVTVEGAVLESLTPMLLSRINAQVSDGAFVSSGYPNRAAERAGLQAGDIIFKIEGRWVMSPQEVVSQLGNYKTGDNLRLGVYSGGQRRNLYLVLSGSMQ
jgi:hypothetical protein